MFFYTKIEARLLLSTATKDKPCLIAYWTVTCKLNTTRNLTGLSCRNREVDTLPHTTALYILPKVLELHSEYVLMEGGGAKQYLGMLSTKDLLEIMGPGIIHWKKKILSKVWEFCRPRNLKTAYSISYYFYSSAFELCLANEYYSEGCRLLST